jgi:hypothetical protein
MTIQLKFTNKQTKVGIHSLTLNLLRSIGVLSIFAYSGNTIIIEKYNGKINIMVDYIYLDNEERARFAQSDNTIENLNNKIFVFNNSKWIYSYKLIDLHKNNECPITYNNFEIKCHYTICSTCKYNFSENGIFECLNNTVKCPMCKSTWNHNNMYINEDKLNKIYIEENNLCDIDNMNILHFIYGAQLHKLNYRQRFDNNILEFKRSSCCYLCPKYIQINLEDNVNINNFLEEIQNENIMLFFNDINIYSISFGLLYKLNKPKIINNSIILTIPSNFLLNEIPLYNLLNYKPFYKTDINNDKINNIEIISEYITSTQKNLYHDNETLYYILNSTNIININEGFYVEGDIDNIDFFEIKENDTIIWKYNKNNIINIHENLFYVEFNTNNKITINYKLKDDTSKIIIHNLERKTMKFINTKIEII